MIPTKEYIEKKFDEYNRSMFDGKLKPLPVRLSNARTFLGAVRYRKKRSLTGRWHYSDFQFFISTKVDQPEKTVEDTIIHEMIHYWIFSSQMQDNAPHGDLFKSKMQEINARFNRNITISHRKTKEEMENDKERRQHLVCISQLTGGRTGITLACKSSIFTLWDRFTKHPEVENCQWYVSADPFFNRFPRSRTLKIYRISPTDLKQHSKDFRPLVREGGVIRVQRPS